MEATIDIRTADGNVNILLDETQVGSLRDVLVDLSLSTMAVFCMLIDAAGRVVATGGKAEEYDLEGVAALAAGDLATTRQLARMLNEPEFALLFQHEKQKNLFMTAVESDAILIVVFDVDTTFGALRLRIRRSISQLQQILHQARKNTVVALASASEATRRTMEEKAEEHEGVQAAEVAAQIEAAVIPAAGPPGSGLPEPLGSEVRKAVAWFTAFRGWEVIFRDEVEFMRRALERNRPEEAENLRMVLVRTRARLTEQKRILEAKFRMLQSIYQQFLGTLQQVMLKAWNDAVVDRAMRAAFAGAGAEDNLVNAGAQKRPEGIWALEFGVIGKHMVTMCHSRGMNYQAGMMELLRQLNACMMALSAFLVENSRVRDELMAGWGRIYKHYGEGLKTLGLEAEVLELFRPLVRPGQLPKV